MRLRLATACSMLLLAGCVQPYYGPLAERQPGPGPGLATQDQTAGIENADRISRFRRLAAMQGIVPPQVDQLMLPPNSVSYMTGPVPVVRVVFDERIFFDFNSDVPRPEAAPVFDLLAENMRRDVPDAAVTVLGHTDAIGTDAYNDNLSARRAASVMKELVHRGVRATQLSEVAIGKRQPIAPNDTEEGRARNRRVEFLVSSGIQANLAAVQQRVVPLSYMSVGNVTPELPRKVGPPEVFGLKPAPDSSNPSTEEGRLDPFGRLPLPPPEELERPPGAVARGPGSPPQAVEPPKVTPPKLLPPDPIEPRQPGELQQL